jgi:hypothetical protein
VTVTHQLPRLTPGNSKAETIDNGVETALKLLQEQFAGHTFGAGGFLEVVAELAFLREVNTLCFLLFAQLQAVADNFGFAIFPVLAAKLRLRSGIYR